MKIALISCTKSKKKGIHRAIDLYQKSALFRGYLRRCKKNNIDDIFILSAKYGLLDKNTFITDYDYTLVGKSDKILKEYGKRINNEIKNTIPLDAEIYLLAGKNYTKYLEIENIIHKPFEGLSIGFLLQKLK